MQQLLTGKKRLRGAVGEWRLIEISKLFKTVDRYVDWNENEYARGDIYTYPTTLDGKVWFLCDKFEEVSRISGGMLAFEDFQHAEGKNLGSCLRNSIAPAICVPKISVKKHYP